MASYKNTHTYVPIPQGILCTRPTVTYTHAAHNQLCNLPPHTHIHAHVQLSSYKHLCSCACLYKPRHHTTVPDHVCILVAVNGCHKCIPVVGASQHTTSLSDIVEVAYTQTQDREQHLAAHRSNLRKDYRSCCHAPTTALPFREISHYSV